MKSTRESLVHEVSRASGYSQPNCKRVLESLLKLLFELMLDGKTVELRDYFTFVVKDRQARTARNPKTGEVVECPPCRKVVCRFSPNIKGRMEGVV